MKLELQVCSLDLAKRLKELGVKQESLFYWLDDGRGDEEDWKIVSKEETRGFVEWAYVSAFTVAELGEGLPKSIIKDDIEYWLEMWKNDKGYALHYEAEVDYSSWKKLGKAIEADTEANARAKMLCHLLENNLIDPSSPHHF